MRTLAFLACIAPLALVVGCTSYYARQRAAFELDCPAGNVELAGDPVGGYEARGCGRQADFVCDRRGFCVREGEVHFTATERLARIPGVVGDATSFDPVYVRAAVTPVVAAAADACGDEPGPHGAGAAKLTFSPDGRVSAVVLDERFDGSGTGACVSERLRAARVPPFRGLADTIEVGFFVRPAA